MAQTLLIGLGGTGSRVVNNVVKELHLNGQEINNGEMCCAVLDTNVNDNAMIQDSNTGVPVFGTSKAQKIRDYLDDYHHLHMETWCPSSPSFLEESMIDGASELRLKSRIAFMDSLETGVTERLELMINDILRNNSGSKIRIMIVSSLSGGTGSGMFIQVALWLRKFLSESEITIRGIFLLPDVFVSTVKDIRANKTTAVRHYCNAYAAIRELNALTKIKKSELELPEEITLGDLFNSITDKDSGKPVYDFAFFVDDKDENGVRLESIAEYEKMVAQLVYMQLYAPMKDDMYSEEDNAFISFVENEEPLYGSCGTSKAVYPTDSVKTYCAIRAAKDSLTGGWKKIDSEINAEIEERKQDERDGVFRGDVIDVRERFVQIFDEKASVSAAETGSDRFFLSISKDIKNETKVKGADGKTTIRYSDKVEDFVKFVKKEKIDVVATEHRGTEDYTLDLDTFVAADHTKEELLDRIKNDEFGLEEAIRIFEENAEEYANGILSSVFPYSMGDVKATNKHSVYGLLTKVDEKGSVNFIHPVSARYVLYKLVKELTNTIKGIVLDTSKDEALTGGDIGVLFDNKATKETETTPVELLNSKKWYQNEAAFLDDFEARYAQFITSKIALCEKYEKEFLMVKVFSNLINRIEALIKQIEYFFENLGEVEEKLNKELAENVEETNGIVGKTMFVFGGKDDKEAVYQSLNFELDRSNVKINKSVIDAIYGKLCAEKRPSNPENAKYLGISVTTAFVKETISEFRRKIDEDDNNKEKVNLNIYTALCHEADAEFAKSGQTDKESGGLDDLDIATGEIKIDDAKEQRHVAAFTNCKNKLFRMAAPFLIHDKEISDNELGTKTTRAKTFWGFHTDIAKKYSFIGTELGVNADLQADEAYPQNELYCYRAVYGMEAIYIPKFNELKGGDYYTCYKAVVDSIVQDAEGRQGERAYVRTPHLDKTWHKILPYITAEKQKQDNLEFFHGFWLAIAYGLIKTDKDGNVFIKRKIDSGYGTFIDEEVTVMYNDKQVTKTDCVKLIEALKTDKVFTGTELPALEARYAEELDEMVTYVGTDVLKGLTVKKEDLNPINFVARYNETPKHNKNVSSALVGALEIIAKEMAERYNTERSDKKIEEAKYRICRKIYDSSKRAKGKSEAFGTWEGAFEAFKIKEDTSETK